MKNFVKLICIFVIVMLVANFQSAAAQHTGPVSATNNVTPESMPMPQIAPLFIDGGQFSSEITVVNDVEANISYEILIQDHAGQALANLKKQIPGHSQQVYRISDLLSSKDQAANGTPARAIAVSPQPIMGTAEIIPDGAGIAAQLSLTYHDTSVALHTEEEFLMPNASISAEYRGVAINTIGNPFIALKNTSPRTLQVALKCFPEGGQPSAVSVKLQPGVLQLVAGCGQLSANDGIDSLLRSSGGQKEKGSFGILITSDANQDELSVFGFSWSHLPSRTLTSILFASPGELRSSDTGFAGVAIGNTPTLGAEPYSPLLALTNFSDSAVEVSITAAFTRAPSTPNTEVTRFNIDPFATRTVTLDTRGADPQLQNSILVQSPVSPGLVAAKLVSATTANAPAVEYQPKDPQQLENSGLHPWSIENGLQSRLLLFNFTVQDQYFNVKIYSGDKPWQKALLLKSMETRAVDIGKIVRIQEKDDYGLTLAKAIVTGELQWSTPGRYKGIGRLLVSGSTQHLARNFSCGGCMLMCKQVLINSPSSLYFYIGGVESFGNGVPRLCNSADCQTCTSVYSSSGGSGYSYYWSSQNTSIASVNGANNGVSASFLGTGVGGTYGEVDISDGICDGFADGTVNVGPKISSIDPNPIMIGTTNGTLTISGQGFGSSPQVTLPSGITSGGQSSTDTQIVLTGVNVAYTATVGNNTLTVKNINSTSATLGINGPYHLVVQNDNTGVCSGCSTTVLREVTYQIQNFDGSNAGATSICETPSFSNWNCQQTEGHTYGGCPGTAQPHTYVTPSSGVFSDDWSMASDSYTPAGCGFNVTDYWNWASHSPVQDLGKLTGYVHTDKVSINGVVSPNKLPTNTVIPF